MTYSHSASSSSRRPQLRSILVLAAALASAGAVACGSGDSMPNGGGVGPDGIPDDRAVASLRNDCFEVAGKGLPSNVGDSTGDGPISRFRLAGDRQTAAWSPIVGSSYESTTSMSRVRRSWTSSSARAPNAVCSSLMPIFSDPSEGNGKDEVRYAMTLQHTVTGFAFPTSLAAAPEVDKPLVVTVASTLRIDYQHHSVYEDGTYDQDFWFTRDADRQEWPLETTCEKPFTVTPRWEAHDTLPAAGAEFCRKAAGGAYECLTFKLDYVGDACTFTARDASIKLPSGGPAMKATFAGFFERATGSDATGYKLRVTNIELP